MRILAIQPVLRGFTIDPLAGGKDVAAVQLARTLVEEGHEVFVLPWHGERYLGRFRVLLSAEGRYATALPTGHFPVNVGLWRFIKRCLTGRGLPLHPVRRVSAAAERLAFSKGAALMRALRDVQPDLVHVHYTHSDFAPVFRRLGCRTPLVLTHHSWGLAETLADYDHVVFVSRHQQEHACRAHAGLRGRCRLIRYCVGGEFQRAGAVGPLRRVIFVGHVTEDKGAHLLVDAYAREPALNRWEAAVVGDGALKDPLERRAREQGLNIRFTGRLGAQRIADLMAEGGALVVPSRKESFGVAYAEALCMGLPIIGYPPTVRELSELLGMEVGLPFDAEAGDAEELAGLIEQVMEPEGAYEPAARKEMRARARQAFRVERFNTEYLAFYKEVIGAAGRPVRSQEGGA